MNILTSTTEAKNHAEWVTLANERIHPLLIEIINEHPRYLSFDPNKGMKPENWIHVSNMLINWTTETIENYIDQYASGNQSKTIVRYLKKHREDYEQDIVFHALQNLTETDLPDLLDFIQRQYHAYGIVEYVFAKRTIELLNGSFEKHHFEFVFSPTYTSPKIQFNHTQMKTGFSNGGFALHLGKNEIHFMCSFDELHRQIQRNYTRNGNEAVRQHYLAVLHAMQRDMNELVKEVPCRIVNDPTLVSLDKSDSRNQFDPYYFNEAIG